MRLNAVALVTIRERSGLSQADLAKAIGTSPGYLHDLENGRRQPSPQLLRQIAEALTIPLVAIISQPTEVVS